jgi:hypothetical protein
MRSLSLIVLLAALGCDARAKAQDTSGAARSEQKSRELESCGASMHCQDGLRCFDQVCRKTERSVVGDYHAALAERHLAAGRIDAALAAFSESESKYQADSVAFPIDIQCAHGRALAAGSPNRERAELAAKVLWRCLAGTPVGASLRHAAMRSLADLDDMGLDPSHLANPKEATVYLSREPSTPKTDSLKITVTADSTPRTFPVPDRLQQADVRAPLVACWTAYQTATKKSQVTVTFGLKAKYVQVYEDEPGKWSVSIDPASGLSGADATADKCVRDAVEPALKKAEGFRDSFNVKLTIVIG